MLPFVAAGVLTFLIGFGDRLHLRSEQVAGYGFLFGIPWAWLVDRGWFEHVHSRFVQSLIDYAVILWIPAILYSACLWLLLVSRSRASLLASILLGVTSPFHSTSRIAV